MGRVKADGCSSTIGCTVKSTWRDQLRGGGAQSCIGQRPSNARDPAGSGDPEGSQGYLAFPPQAAQEQTEAVMEHPPVTFGVEDIGTDEGADTSR